MKTIIITKRRKTLLLVGIDLAIEEAQRNMRQAKLANRSDHVSKTNDLLEEYEKLKKVII